MSRMWDQDMEARRAKMVESQIAHRGIKDRRLLAVMRRIPRERFLPPNLQHQAYEDRALPTECGQTISQPYIVACMTQALRLDPHHRVLEIGTGTGYQTAILAELANHVYSIESHETLSTSARQLLASLGIANVTFSFGDGSLGWADHAPFDRIIVTAAAPRIIEEIVDQLADGGRLVIPVGDASAQRLTTVERAGDRLVERPSIAVRFVKLLGEGGFKS